jgi:NADH-quinone oxidoreductase subunit A
VLRSYLVFLMLLVFVAGNAAMMIVMSHMMGPRRPTEIKGSPYESGIPPLGDARARFSVKFYLVAMMFIVFDIEVVFLVPWAAIYFSGTGATSMGALLVEMLVFLATLFVGYVYAWKRGAFRWD